MRKVKLIFFDPGQQAEHEGVTYVAELQAKGGLCVDIIDSSNIIFKKV